MGSHADPSVHQSVTAHARFDGPITLVSIFFVSAGLNRRLNPLPHAAGIISKIEGRRDMLLSTLRGYVEVWADRSG